MPFVRPLLLAALLVAIPAAAGAAADRAPERPFRLRCEIDFGQPSPTVQFYSLDPAAGEVLAEPGSRYTRAGTPEESEALTGQRIIESWTDEEVVFTWDVRSKTGPQRSVHRDTLDLRTLTLRIDVATQLRTMTLSPSVYRGRCKRVAMDPAG